MCLNIDPYTKSIFSGFISVYIHSVPSFQVRKLSNETNHVDLAYDLYDKYKCDNALVIAHGLFASKMSWRSVARRINEQTKQKVYIHFILSYA